MASTKDKVDLGGILLAHGWNAEKHDPTGWWVSEKLDGVRAYWDGKKLISRGGVIFRAPEWFIKNFPEDMHLDGELYMGRGKFQTVTGVVRRHNGGEAWAEVVFMVFDCPTCDGPFEDRMVAIEAGTRHTPYAEFVKHWVCKDKETLEHALDITIKQGGEGLMLREPGSLYERKRSKTLLKVKKMQDAEALVIGHQPGKGKHVGRMGALLCKLPSGVKFRVGTGFSDAQREDPPIIGSVITFRFQELSLAGVPRFPAYLRQREDVKWFDIVSPPNGKTAQSTLEDFI